MTSAIGAALISTILEPMLAEAKNIIKNKGLDKAMDIIIDKGQAIVRSMADKAMDKVLDKAEDKVMDTPMDRAMAMVVDKGDGIANIERDISRLQTTLYMIEGIVRVAEQKQIDDDFIRNWLRDLVDIAYEARDVLDDFITFSSCIIRAEEASNPVNFISSLMLSCFGGLSSDTSKLPVTILNRLEKDIRSVRERFDEKKKECETFATLISVVEGGGSESVKTRTPVGPFINKQRDGLFLGREEVKQEIMEKILHPSDDRVDVVVIWGMGGIGKTTLAQSIYNDERVKEVPRSWLCVGVNKFSAEKVIKEIVNDKKTIGIVNLQTKLVEKFEGNRFLIVLDDVWDVDGSEWNLLFDPLTNVGKGGLIIITRREKEVCLALINIQRAYNLQPLSEEDSWSIFKSCAYANGKSDSTPDLKGIGKDIVKKLNGLPLALKVVGGSLLNKDYSTWTDFLESKFSKDDEVMSALRWSYNHLPPHLKMCFTYCSLFPEDHVLDKKVLVEMWMAHDLIKKEKQKRPEDVGAQYFEQLLNASLLQCVDGKHVMHDLIHDLALLVSNEEFATANSSLTNDQMETVRHVTIKPRDYSKVQRLCKMEKLLTLYTIDEIYPTEKSYLDVFSHLKSIRVLVLVSSIITDIPDCIRELRHLRYIDVSRTCVSRLPDYLCLLYNLQMLAAPFDAELPIDIVNISSLRYVRARLSTCKGVGKLTSLQELSSVHVCKGDNIRELGDMQILRGQLRIEGLENVSTLEGDAGALMEKQTLMDALEINFNEQLEKSTISEKVLDSLGCPPNLTYLKISGYTGVKSPSWMVDGKHKFDKLHTLMLSHCPKLESLPPLGELTSLKYLTLRNVGVKRLGDEFYGKFTDGKVFFPSLEWLNFDNMKGWEEWDDIIIENSSMSFFPSLTTLKIEHCAKLVSLLPVLENPIMNAANFMTSLSSLDIKDCDGLKQLQLDALVSLEYLKIKCCRQLQSLPAYGFFPSLTYLRIISCPLLYEHCKDESGLDWHFMTSLSHLEICDCDGLKRLQLDALVSLTELKISNCSSLVQITSAICESLEISSCRLLEKMDVARCDSLVVIKILNLEDCESLRSLSIDDGMDSLEDLHISDCPKLELAFEDGSSSSSTLGNSVAVPIHSVYTDSTQVFRTLLHHELVSLESLGITNLGGFENFDETEANNFCKLRSLKSLRILQCKDLKSLPADFHKLSSLERLYIYYCPQLQSLPPDFHKLSSLEELEIYKCPQLKSLPLDFQKLSSLKKLRIDDCPQLQSLPLDFYKLSSLEELEINRCPQLESLPPDFHKLSSLEELEIKRCPQLQSLPPDFHELSSLKKLSIDDCPQLQSLPLDFHTLSSLEELEINRCPQLQSLSAYGFPPSLTYLQIIHCPLLYEHCKDEHGLDWHFMTSLSHLEILDCVGLKRLQLDALVSLKKLEIKRCSSLVQITSAICERLQISSCRLLEKMDVARCDSVVVVKILELVDCESLRSLSIDIHGMDSLEDLRIHGCPKLELAVEDGSSSSSSSGNSVAVPIYYISSDNTQVFRTLLHHELVSLEYLGITNLGGFENFDKTEANNFCKLRSLKILRISQCEDLKSLPADFHKLTPLEELYINGCPQLQSLPPDFHKLSSIKKLHIYDCPQLHSLPAYGFPPSLTYLQIIRCPLLYEHCKDEYGLDWHFMTSLSHLEILDCVGLKRLQLDALVSLKKLEIKCCSSLVQITSAICERLQISSCRLLEKLDVARCDSVVVIKILELVDCESLRSLSIDIHGMDSIEDLRIHGCPKLQLTFEDGSSSSSTSGNSVAVPIHNITTDNTQAFRTLFHHELISLESLDITDLGGFENFDETEANNFCKLRSLKILSISQCEDLMSLPPDFHKLSSLVELFIYDCPQLQSLPADWHFMKSLSHLKICACDGLKRLQLDALVSLKELKIKRCSSLVQITSTICESLEISSCRLLEKMDVASCDSLQVVIKILKLEVEYCESLRSLRIDIHRLDSLEDLRIRGCPKLELAFEDGSSTSSSSGNSVAVPIRRISIDSTQVFRTLLHHELVSRKYLCITNLGGLENFDEIEAKNFCELRSLKILHISQCEDLMSLPPDFHKLSSLEELFIYDCPQLQSLHADWHFMTSLSHLEICDCDGLKRMQLDALVSLKELKISNCSSLLQITSAICESLEISSCILLEKIGVARCDSLVVIKILKLEDCESLRSLSIDDGLDSLEDLRIHGFPTLELEFEVGSSSSSSLGNSVVVPLHYLSTDNTQVFRTFLHHELVSLQYLGITNLGGLENFDETEAKNFCKLISLKILSISQCEDLMSLPPDFHKLSSLEKLFIYDCPQLQSLPVDWHFMTSLSHLEICACDGLKRLQLDALVSLKELKIKHCSSLVQITSAICESLEISSCRLLEKMDVARFDSLLVVIKILKIEYCESLRSLSIDIHGMDSLKVLTMYGCPTLKLAFEDGSSSSSSSGNSVAVPIHRIYTDSTQVFRTLLHHKLVSLKYLGIANLGGLENFDKTEAKNFCKSRSLKRLYISQCEDLMSLPPDFHKLSSLKKLTIYDCPQLQSLPADGLPPSLTYLQIISCPLLYERCKDESGLDWHKINHIPEREIRLDW